MRLQIVLSACFACSGGQPKPEPQSWSQHMQAAEKHEQRAEQHDRAAAATKGSLGNQQFDCGDPVLADQVTSGGQRINTWQPCFDIEDEAADRHREVAAHERRLARKDFAAAGRLADAQRIACEGIPERELHHSPFSHARSIDKVEPMYRDNRLIGVRVVFKPVRGLTAEWLRRDIDCQRARWAVFGKPPTWMPNDPTFVDGARIDVADRGPVVEVVVTTQTVDQAAIALARARGQLGQTATR